MVELEKPPEREFPSFYEKVIREVPDEVVDIAQVGRSRVTVCLPSMAPLAIQSTQPCDDVVLCAISKANPRVSWRYNGAKWRETAVVPGHLIVMPSRVYDEWHSDGLYEAVEIAFPHREVARILAEAGIGGSVDFPALGEKYFYDPFLAATVGRLKTLIGQPGAHDAIFADTLAEALVLGMARQAHARGPSRRPVRRLSFRELRRVQEFAAANLSLGISLQDFAGLLEMTEFHFSRAFKATTGDTPHQWLLRRRVERARLLMAVDPPLSGHEIARECGFADHPHLARVLRRMTGATLGELRRR